MFGSFHAHTDVDVSFLYVITHGGVGGGGCTDTIRESALCVVSWFWEKNPMPHWRLKPTSVLRLAFESDGVIPTPVLATLQLEIGCSHCELFSGDHDQGPNCGVRRGLLEQTFSYFSLSCRQSSRLGSVVCFSKQQSHSAVSKPKLFQRVMFPRWIWRSQRGWGEAGGGGWRVAGGRPPIHVEKLKMKKAREWIYLAFPNCFLYLTPTWWESVVVTSQHVLHRQIQKLQQNIRSLSHHPCMMQRKGKCAALCVWTISQIWTS